MPITYMTPSRIEYAYGDRTITLQGEALESVAGKSNYLVFASSATRWNSPHLGELLSDADRERVLLGVEAELRRRGFVPEVIPFRGQPVLAAVSGRVGVAAGNKCPETGFWSSPSSPTSRRYFFQGEALPDLKTQFGTTVWQWDEDQDSPASI